MNVKIHPSSEKNSKLLLLELLENSDDMEGLMVAYRRGGDVVLDCDDSFSFEDIAMVAMLMQAWFQEIYSGDQE